MEEVKKISLKEAAKGTKLIKKWTDVKKLVSTPWSIIVKEDYVELSPHAPKYIDCARCNISFRGNGAFRIGVVPEKPMKCWVLEREVLEREGERGVFCSDTQSL